MNITTCSYNFPDNYMFCSHIYVINLLMKGDGILPLHIIHVLSIFPRICWLIIGKVIVICLWMMVKGSRYFQYIVVALVFICSVVS